jgi:hypothetical protein
MVLYPDDSFLFPDVADLLIIAASVSPSNIDRRTRLQGLPTAVHQTVDC